MNITKNHSILITVSILFGILLCPASAMSKKKYPQELKQWVTEGSYTRINRNKIFVHASGKKSKKGHGVLVIHGYPGSSWDWINVVSIVEKKARIVVPDMLGFGHSAKPKKGTFKKHYSLFKQADLYETIAKKEGFKDVILVAHDMGQTVAAELMARQDEGKLSFKIKHVIILNGSTLIDLVKLVPLQKDLLGRPDTILKKHLNFDDFREDLRNTFSKDYAASEKTLDIMATQVFNDNGDLIMPRIIRYMIERKENFNRWVGILTRFHSAPMSVYWGTQDPVSVELMADRIKLWRPTTDLYKMPDVGHWPSIEVPNRIAKAILDRYEGQLGSFGKN